jgi:hypothetical protein
MELVHYDSCTSFFLIYVLCTVTFPIPLTFNHNTVYNLANSGLKQGCLLSPNIFIIVMDYIR